MLGNYCVFMKLIKKMTTMDILGASAAYLSFPM